MNESAGVPAKGKNVIELVRGKDVCGTSKWRLPVSDWFSGHTSQTMGRIVPSQPWSAQMRDW